MTAPVPDIQRRAVVTHRGAERHAQGELRAVMPRAQSSPSTATGTPRTTDHELVVTAVQLMIPAFGHANAAGSV
jgi:hypothetical protein